ncbi:MAG: DUF4956 domain-containing protein [Gemmatimonadaceae bacterium]
MAVRAPAFMSSPATRMVVRVVVYYAVLIAVGFFARRQLPGAAPLTGESFSTLLAEARTPYGESTGAAADSDRTLSVVVAMVSAILLSLPVAWVYQLTRAKRGYQQSVVQLLIILPLVVAGIVVLVKYSLALAFSLAGIVAAVRFRNTLDDSKDAVYVFLATGIGLSAAVDIPVAAALSMLFNTTILALWYTDFGNSPMELEGKIAARRLKRAKELARTGTFVAQIDNEVLRNMTREQLEGVAQRALKRAHDDGSKGAAVPSMETCLRITSRDMDATRRRFESVMGDFAKQWRAGIPVPGEDGVQTLDYYIQPKKTIQPDELIALVKTAAGPELVDAEIR